MSDKSRLNRVLLFFGLLLCVFDLTKPLEQYHPEDLHVNRFILSVSRLQTVSGVPGFHSKYCE